VKLIEALKKRKDLFKKAEDLRDKVKKNSAYYNYETPPYENPTRQVRDWIQAHQDILKEILRLDIAIQRTNLETQVTILLPDGKGGDIEVTKSIAEWIHRRRELAQMELLMWQGLTDRNLKEGTIIDSMGEKKEVKIVRNYSPEERDNKVSALYSEPSTIDARLEIVNAVTDVIFEDGGEV
jgi:hypothetical protein